MRILIVDSGSTKTDWVIVSEKGETVKSYTSVGINPIIQTETEIIGNLQALGLSSLGLEEVTTAFYYGAGCATERETLIIQHVLQSVGLKCKAQVFSDIIGAARALLQFSSGIAGILGTGCNSCLYDGNQIVRSVPPLGYILGDEGSGAYLGKLLLANIYKGVFSKGLCERFFTQYPALNRAEMMSQVYRRPYPNRFMASFAPFIKSVEHYPEIKELLFGAFDLFFQRNILLYNEPEMPVAMIGSISYYFEAHFMEAARRNNVQIVSLCRSPIEGLITYHCKK